MRRLAAAAGAVAVIAVPLALAGGGGSGNRNLRAELSDAVEHATVVDLGSLTSFRWTAVYAFGPAAGAAEVDAALGFVWRDAPSEAPLALGHRPVLLFVDGRRVVRMVDYAHGAGRTECLQGRRFARAEARFVVAGPARVLVPAVRPAARQRQLVARCLARMTPR